MKKYQFGDMGDGNYKNPILYIDYSDPDAIRVGEDYYMIASSFCNAPGLPLLHSKDMVNWTQINNIISAVPEEKYTRPVHGCGVWAPSIRYHEGIFYVCFPMPDEGIYMTTAVNPYGEWSEPVNIRPGAGWIDPCPFWDEDGRAYLVAGVAKSRIGYKSVLHIAEMQPDGMGLIGEEVKVFDGNLNDQVTIEGPKLYKRNGWYYIFAPAGGVKTGWQTVLRSKNIYGPYEYKVVMRQDDTQVNGPHQGAWVDTEDGEDWFIHFQDVYAAGRIIHLQPMTFENDWPVIGARIEGKDYGKPVDVYKKPVVRVGKQEITYPQTDDDFTGNTLSLNWQWNANPLDSFYEMTGNGIRLNAVKKEEYYSEQPNLLLQKWPYPEFTCDTVIDIKGLQEGNECGIISMGMEYGALYIGRNSSGTSLWFTTGKQKFGKIFCEETIQATEKVADLKVSDCLYFRYEVKRCGIQDLNEKEKGFPLEKVTFYYSVDGVSFVEGGSMKAVPGRWVGVKNGVFCVKDGDDKKGSVIVKSVRYSG